MYSPAVRIGNWFEELEIEKEQSAAFMGKRERGELLVQHTRRLFHNLFREARLSRNDGFVQFENCVQLKAPDVPRSSPASPELSLDQRPFARRAGDNEEFGLVMAGTIHEKHIKSISNLAEDCRLIASPIFVPCSRNCFVIKSADGTDRAGQNLVFGQEFILQIINNSDGEAPLYARSENPLVDQAHGPLDHNPIVLSNKRDRYCIWKVLHWDKNMRFESEGAPFPSFTRVVLRHAMSGLDLAVEGTVWWLSIFGNECGMSVHTYVDNSKQETAECAWMFITSEINETLTHQKCE